MFDLRIKDWQPSACVSTNHRQCKHEIGSVPIVTSDSARSSRSLDFLLPKSIPSNLWTSISKTKKFYPKAVLFASQNRPKVGKPTVSIRSSRSFSFFSSQIFVREGAQLQKNRQSADRRRLTLSAQANGAATSGSPLTSTSSSTEPTPPIDPPENTPATDDTSSDNVFIRLEVRGFFFPLLNVINYYYHRIY